MKKSILFALLLAAAGCCSSYYKAVDGTDMLIGLSLPDENYVQINAVHYLNGDKTVVKTPSCIEHEYSMSETNSYFGVIQTTVARSSKIKVRPVLTNATDKVEQPK